MIRKGWILAFALVMTAVCLFLCWSVVDRHALEARTVKARENLEYQQKRIPRQALELAEAEAAIPEARARVEALAPLVTEAEAAKTAAQTEAARYTAGYSKASQARKAYKERAEAAEARLEAAREAYEAALGEIGGDTP